MSTQQLNFKYQVAADSVQLSSKQACRLIATTPLSGGVWAYSGSGPTGTLTAPGNGVTNIDSRVVALNDRILVTAEATGTHNGIYTCTTAGASGVTAVFTRANDADTSAAVQSCTVPISDGALWAGSEWIGVTQAVVLDTSTLAFQQVQGTIGAGAAGTGLAFSGGSLHLALNVEGTHTTVSSAITLNNTPNAIIMVALGGIVQNPTNYTISGSTITFPGSFPDGTSTFVVYE